MLQNFALCSWPLCYESQVDNNCSIVSRSEYTFEFDQGHVTNHNALCDLFTCEDMKFSQESSLGISLAFI